MLDDPSTVWWIAAGVLVAVELATGTFYLLMLAVGAAAAAVVQMTGASTATQIAAAAIVGGGATALWHFLRARSPRSAPAQSNSDVFLDIGQTVQVAHWQQDGTCRVHYRGTDWDAIHQGPAPAAGLHRIVAVQGNRLELQRCDAVQFP